MLRALRLAFAAAVVATVSTFAGSPASQASTPAPRGLLVTRVCTNCVDDGGDLSRYQYVILNAWNHDRLAPLKAANPAAKGLVYKDMASSRSYSCGGLIPAGVDYCWAHEHRPHWFTEDTAGGRIEWSPYPGAWQMDVGDPEYQRQWAENVIGELRANGWDGVVVDNANVDQSGYLAGRTMHEYQTQSSYQSATRGFLAAVCPRVIAAGFLCLPNIQAHPVIADAKLWADWTQFTSGGSREWWMKWGTGTDGHYGARGWADLMNVLDTVQRAGKIFLTGTVGPMSDVRSMRWGRASFLVGWDGGPSAFSYEDASKGDAWSAEWAADIGTPVGTRFAVGNIWRRNYSAGTALVNVSETDTERVELGGDYQFPDGATTDRVTLAPLTGIVLRGGPPHARVAPKIERLTLRVRPARRARGRTFVATGEIVAGSGFDLGRTKVRVLVSRGHAWRTLRSLKPRPSGGFRFRVAVGSSTLVRVRVVAEHSGGMGRSRVVSLRARHR